MLGVVVRYFFRYFYVYVFALLSILGSGWVASNPDKTVRLVRPLVEDAVELKQLADGAYRDVTQLNWQEASDEAVSLFVATMRMPTMLLERLSEKLDKVDRDLKRRSSADAGTGLDIVSAKKTALTIVPQAKDRATASPHQPEI